MPAHRVFLDWRRPALLAAVDYLRQKYARGGETPPKAAAIPRRDVPRSSKQRLLGFDEPEVLSESAATASGGEWDLSRVIVVVPGRRAGRRLLELLIFEARDRGLALTPPDITTEGQLPERLYVPKKPFADLLTQDLAWSQALRQLPEKQRSEIVPHPPAHDDATAWLQLGRMLRVRHTELAADGLGFGDVVQQGKKLPAFPDARRWQAMHAAQLTYLRTLDELELWDIQTARLKAIEWKEISTESDVVLLGTVDLNRTLRKILDQVPDRVAALIAAPETLADRFDAHGCVRSEAWQQVEIALPDDRVLRVDGAADQADAVARIMAEYQGQYRGDQITIGVPDELLVPHVQRQLEQCSVPVRWVEGKLLPETAPYRLLAALADLLEGESPAALAALLRHPNVFMRLTARKGEDRVDFAVLEELSELQVDHLLSSVDPASWPWEVKKKLEAKQNFANVAKAIEELSTLVAPLRARPQRLSQWSEAISSLLQTVYVKERDDPHTLDALEHIGDCLRMQALLPERLDPLLPAADAIRWTLAQLRDKAIPPPASDEAVELLGWLELPLDDAPALIVTTLNEGFVPKSLRGDAFLPNALRTSLGIIDNDRHYARDAYAASAILASRQSVHWISARRDAEENPLAPSRLLFATAPEKIVTRARAFFQPLKESSPRPALIGAGTPPLAESRLYVPRPPDDIELPMRLRVTQFRDFLTCPYRFYLRHLLKVEAATDRCEELEGNAFGNLIHKVLERFGANESIRDSQSEDEIADFLLDELMKWMGIRYGEKGRLASVEIQLAQMKARLKTFAAWQARRRGEGWRIVHSETTRGLDDVQDTGIEDKNTSSEQTVAPSETDAEILVDGVPFLLGGRIDRIDQHEDGQRLRIYDYKTGDRVDKPERAHRRRTGEWTDLQLPLYRHLAEAWGFEGEMQLGYIRIPKAHADIGDCLAGWTSDDLAAADETMRSVVRKIRLGEFYPPAEPLSWVDDYTVLCQDRRLGGRLFETAATVKEAAP